MRRALIAASSVLAVGGTLAIASSASAINIPIGTSADSAPTQNTINGLYNEANAGLLQAQQLVAAAGVDAANFPAPFTSASSLSATNVAQIAQDVANPAYTSSLELTACAGGLVSAGQTEANAVAACETPGSTYLAAAQAAFTTEQPQVALAAASWTEFSGLLLVASLDPADFPAGIFTVDGALQVSSSATVTAAGSPAAYTIAYSTTTAAKGGYVIPSSLSLTIPADFGVNTALVKAEINASSNTAAVEAKPTGPSIGTVKLTTPGATIIGASGKSLTGKIYVITTGAGTGAGSLIEPYLELNFGNGVYVLGTAAGSYTSLPLTIDFGEAQGVTGYPNGAPLPFSSLQLSFPAATSPVRANSCTNLGTVTGTATDNLAALGLEFGDSSDGLTSATGTAAAVKLAATRTVVTNGCTSASGSGSGLTGGEPTFTLKVKAPAFKTLSVGLPGGLKFVKAKQETKELSLSGASVKSAKIAGGKLVITLKKNATSVTLKLKKGAVSETNGLINSIKHKKTKNLGITLKAGSKSIADSIKA